ncbi:MAG: LysR substrate-binding domain-containing protein [Pseudomonadota bacterium]
MNFRDLEYVVAIAEQRGFSAAAVHCHVSQPTLSAQIRKLENELGCILFQRSNKRVIPTDEGWMVIERAKRILAEVDALKHDARRAGDPLAGRLRLGAFPTLASYLFPKLVGEIIKSMPKLQLILIEEKTDDLLMKLHDGTVDAAFLALPVVSDQLHVEPLFEDPFWLAVGPASPLVSSQSVSIDDLAALKLLLLEEGHCLRAQALELCKRAGTQDEADFRATSLETLRMMVKAGTGVTLIPEIAIQRDDPEIRYVPFELPAPSRTIGLVWRRTTHRAALMKRLVDLSAARCAGESHDAALPKND